MPTGRNHRRSKETVTQRGSLVTPSYESAVTVAVIANEFTVEKAVHDFKRTTTDASVNSHKATICGIAIHRTAQGGRYTTIINTGATNNAPHQSGYEFCR